MIVVLASLAILTIIFAIASQRSMTLLQTVAAEEQLLARQHRTLEILQIVASAGPEIAETTSLQLPTGPVDPRIQDVGGLIDLNTASPELLGQLFDALDFPADADDRFRAWRRDGRRLQRVDDVVRITGADPAITPTLHGVATVHSGRRGIAADVAPQVVLDIAAPAQVSPRSGTNFAIYHNENQKEVLVGVVSIVVGEGQSRILEAR